MGERRMTTAGHGLDSRFTQGVLALYAVLVGFFLVLPLVLAVILAFSSGNNLQFPPPGFSFQWMHKAAQSEPFQQGLVISLIVALCSSLISAIAGSAAAVAINHFRFSGRALMQVFLMSPLSMPGIVVGLAVLFVLPWFGMKPGIVSNVCGHSVIGTPYVAYMVLASLNNYDMTLDRAAANLGAGRWRTFKDITLPLIWPGIAAGTICAFLLSFDNVALSLFLSKGDTLPLRLMQSIQFYADPSVAAASVILVFMSFAALPFLQRAFKDTANVKAL
jgi:putative spermidine/putrescine transport system permease protein